MDLIDIARMKICLVVRSMARTIVPNIAINLSMEAIIINTDWRPSFSDFYCHLFMLAADVQVVMKHVTKLSSLDRPCIALHMRPSKMWLTECEVKEQARGRFQ